MFIGKDDIVHYGVKGMKWGVKRQQRRAERRERRFRKKYGNPEDWSDDYREYVTLKSKKNYRLSNAEMQKVNNRSNLEQQFHKNKAAHIAAGIAAVSSVLAIAKTFNDVINTSNNTIKLGQQTAEQFKSVYVNAKKAYTNASSIRKFKNTLSNAHETIKDHVK